MLFLVLLIGNTTMVTDRTGKSSANYMNNIVEIPDVAMQAEHRMRNKALADIFNAHYKEVSSLCENIFLKIGLSEFQTAECTATALVRNHISYYFHLWGTKPDMIIQLIRLMQK